MKTVHFCLAMALLFGPLCSSGQSLDPGFGFQGHLLLNNEERLDQPTTKLASMPTNSHAHFVLADGSVIFAARSSGSSMFVGGSGGLLVGKLQPNGSIDAGFGDNGYFFYSTPQASLLNEMQGEPDGKILVSAQNAQYHGVLIRLRANGTPDSSFGRNGIAAAANSSPFSNDGYTHAVRRPDGRYWIVRTQTNFNISYKYMETMLLKANGTPDSTYGVNGVFGYSSIRYPFEQEIFPVLHANGYLSIVFKRDSSSIERLSVFRIKPNGTADSSLGTNGLLIYPYMPVGVHYINVEPAADGLRHYVVYPNSGDSSYVYCFQYNGNLDSSYGRNGRSVLKRTGDMPGGTNLWLRPDGKLAVSAYSNTVLNRSYVFLLKSDGAIDSSFGTLGAWLTTDFPGRISGNANRIVTYNGDYTSPPRDSANFYFDMLTNAGIRDPLISAASPLVVKYTGSKESLTASARQTDGMTIIGGTRYKNPLTTFNNQAGGMWLRRLLSDGQPDASYGTNGIAYNTDGLNSGLNDMTLLPNNSLLTAGARHLRRFTAGGLQDISFGTNGLVDIARVYPTLLDSNYMQLTKVVAQPDGRILVFGYGAYATTTEVAFVVRLLANGSADAGFGQGGLAVYGPGGNSEQAWSRSLTLLPDGRILLTIASDQTNSNAITFTYVNMLRIKNDGKLDSSFGINGRVTYSAGPGGRLKPRDVVVLPDNSLLLLVSGSSAQFSGSGYSGADTTSYLLRYSWNGTRDNNFGNSGSATIHGTANRIQQLRDGRLLIASLVNSWGNIDSKPQTVWLTRIKYNGRLDSSFGTNGYLPLSDRYSSINVAYHNNLDEVRTDPMPALLLPLGDSSSFLAGSTIEQRNWDGMLERVTGFRDSFPAQQVVLLDTMGNTSCNPVSLFWRTTRETGSDRFFLQRTTDGSNYTNIATITASGTTNGNTLYTYNYTAPDTLVGTYRVVLMGRVGSTSYSNILTRRRTNAALTPTIAISYSGCGTGTVSFAPTATNAGSGATFQWYVNTVLSGTGNTLALSNPSNGTSVYARLTSSLSCASPQSVNSATVIINCTATAVSNLDGLESLELAPNPTSGPLQVRLKLQGLRSLGFVVRDVAGRMVYTSAPRSLSGSQQKMLDLGGLATGVYYLEISVGKGRTIIPIVVQRR
jgi:uncharacterized delta-60 repeat protein